MTKTWVPNRIHSSKKRNFRRIKYSPAIIRRNGFMAQARIIARTENMNTNLKISAIKDRVSRANEAEPISQRQVNGLIELLGSSVTEKIMEGL